MFSWTVSLRPRSPSGSSGTQCFTPSLMRDCSRQLMPLLWRERLWRRSLFLYTCWGFFWRLVGDREVGP